jgi:hypothetical protein
MWGSLEFYGPLALLLAVSTLYFVLDKPDTHMRLRLATSAHGAIGVGLFLIAYMIAVLFPGGFRPYLAWPYLALFLLPLASIIFALRKYRGPGLLHIMQGPNIAALVWVMLVGAMAITGDWL